MLCPDARKVSDGPARVGYEAKRPACGEGQHFRQRARLQQVRKGRAAALLGSQVVLVGISAEVAQTLVQLGLDLGQLVTLSNLQSGLEYALSRQGLAITASA